MNRSFGVALGMLVCIVAVGTAQEGPPAQKKLIERIQNDMGDAHKKLQDKDPGAQTQQTQKRIIDGINELLNQPEENKNNSSPNASKQNPPQPPQAPPGNPSQEPQTPPGLVPPKNPGPMSKPTQGQEIAQPVGKEASKEVGADKNAPAQKNTLAELLSKHNGEQWTPALPPKHRQEMDAFARERFIQRYEELLRAYYRNIAASGARKKAE